MTQNDSDFPQRIRPRDMLREVEGDYIRTLSDLFGAENPSSIYFHIQQIEQEYWKQHFPRYENGVWLKPVRLTYIFTAINYLYFVEQEFAPQDIVMLFVLVGAKSIEIEQREPSIMITPAKFQNLLTPQAWQPLESRSYTVEMIREKMLSFGRMYISSMQTAGSPIDKDDLIRQMCRAMISVSDVHPFTTYDTARMSFVAGEICADLMANRDWKNLPIHAN